MIDLRFSYDYQIFLNENLPIGVLHTFHKSMIDVRFKDTSFVVKKKLIGRFFNNVRV